jgi:hypothetical protein
MHSRSTGGRSARPLPLAALGLSAILCLPAAAQAGSLARSLDYLSAHQDRVGGGFAVGGGTDPGYTAWAALAVSAAGEDTARWRRGRRSLETALRRPLTRASLGDIEQATVAIAAAGMDPRVVGGRNLVREVLRAQGTDGTIGPDFSTTAWGILALSAGGLGRGSQAITSGAKALERVQRPDGGWSLTDEDPRSGPNTTAVAIQALVAAGRDPTTSAPLRRARLFLLSAQNPDGGFPPVVGGPSTALTTAWVALAIRSFGDRSSLPPWDRAGGPLALLGSLQLPDGGVRNAAESKEASVWATSQAALAFSGKYLPYARRIPRPVPLRAPHVVARHPLSGGRLRGRALTVRYRDDAGGTGVDPAAVRLWIGGRELTRRATVTSAMLKLPRGWVPRGRATVSLSLSDRAGNGRSVRWRIVVPGR